MTFFLIASSYPALASFTYPFFYLSFSPLSLFFFLCVEPKGVNYLPNRTRKKAARRHEKNFRLALGRRRFILSSSSPSYSSHSNRDLSSPLSSSLSSAFLSPYSSTRNVKGKETDDCRNEKVKTRAMEEREENMREKEEKKDKRKEKQSSHFKKRRNKKSATQSPQKVISSTSISSDHQKDDHGERGEEIKRVGSAQSEDTHPLSIKQPHLLFPPHSHSLTLSTSSKSLNLSSDQSLYQPSDLFQAIERSQPDKLYSSLQLALSTKKKRNEKEDRRKENTMEGKGEESAERLHRRETNGESNIKKKDSTLEGSLGCRPMSKECPLHVAVLLGKCLFSLLDFLVCFLRLFSLLVFFVCFLCLFSLLVFFVCFLCLFPLFVSFACFPRLFPLFVFFVCFLCLFSLLVSFVCFLCLFSLLVFFACLLVRLRSYFLTYLLAC